MKKTFTLFLALLTGSVTLIAQSVIPPERRCPVVNIKKSGDTICGRDNGGVYQIEVAIRGSNLSVEWSSDGFGYFVVNGNDVFYFYDVSDAGRGSVLLNVTVTDTLSRCAVARDSLFLKLNDPARISFPNIAQPVCGNYPVYIEANISGTASSVNWQSSGTGYFADNSFGSVTYYPSFYDRTQGSVTITGTTNDPEGPCPAASAFTYLIFTDGVVDAGPDLKICASEPGGVIELIPAVYGNLYSGTWTTNGTGTFDDAASIYTNYNYTAADVARGNIELYITADLFDCGIYTDTVKVWLQQPPVFTLPREFVSSCGKRPVVPAEVQLTGTISGGTWTGTGSGVFANPNSLTTIYKASRADMLARCVQLVFKSNAEDPCGQVSSKPIKACFYEQCYVRKNSETIVENNNKSISIYPNPATSLLNISNTAGIQIKSLNITDITGKNIQFTWAASNSLNIAALKPGIYFLHAFTSSGKTAYKFIKL